MASIKDVAKKANLSVATVSRVMGNKEHVTEKTRKKVEAAIAELNYQPNVTARRLRERKTNCIIVIVPDICNTFFPEVFRGIESVAMKRDYRVLLEDIQNDVEIERKIFNSLPQKQVDGVISLTAKTERKIIESVADEYPLVIAGQFLEDTEIPHVGINNFKAAQDAVEHLLKLGHTRIAHISGPIGRSIFMDRMRGYCSALERAGLEADSQFIFYGAHTFESGYELAGQIMRLEDPVTAIFAGSDEMAAGAMKALKAAGKRIPEDYAVVGFDDVRIASIVEPEITTIYQPKQEMGAKAMEMLFDIMDGKTLENNRVILEHKLMIRQSCGAFVQGR